MFDRIAEQPHYFCLSVYSNCSSLCSDTLDSYIHFIKTLSDYKCQTGQEVAKVLTVEFAEERMRALRQALGMSQVLFSILSFDDTPKGTVPGLFVMGPSFCKIVKHPCSNNKSDIQSQPCLVQPLRQGSGNLGHQPAMPHNTIRRVQSAKDGFTFVAPESHGVENIPRLWRSLRDCRYPSISLRPLFRPRTTDLHRELKGSLTPPVVSMTP